MLTEDIILRKFYHSAFLLKLKLFYHSAFLLKLKQFIYKYSLFRELLWVYNSQSANESKPIKTHKIIKNFFGARFAVIEYLM